MLNLTGAILEGELSLEYEKYRGHSPIIPVGIPDEMTKKLMGSDSNDLYNLIVNHFLKSLLPAEQSIKTTVHADYEGYNFKAVFYGEECPLEISENFGITTFHQIENLPAIPEQFSVIKLFSEMVRNCISTDRLRERHVNDLFIQGIQIFPHNFLPSNLNSNNYSPAWTSMDRFNGHGHLC